MGFVFNWKKIHINLFKAFVGETRNDGFYFSLWNLSLHFISLGIEHWEWFLESYVCCSFVIITSMVLNMYVSIVAR